MSIEIMQAVWRHSQSQGRARLVLLAIADHQGEIGAWPSIATLAKMVNASERSVQRDIQELQDLGELTVEVQNAPVHRQYKSNLYWVNLPGLYTESPGVTESHSGVTELESGVTESAPGVTTGGVQTLNLTITKPLLKNHVHQDALFEEFWTVYPRKQNKIQAKKLYRTALTKCEHETLIATARRYAKDPNRLDAYTKMASTWLANECWNDAPLPERIGATPAVDLEALRAKTAREKQATKELIASMAREGTPPPQCEHGNSIARCPRCLAK